MRKRVVHGERLRRLRLARERTLVWLADRTGISKSALSRLELGLRPAKVDEIERILSALGSNTAHYFGDRG